MKREYIQNQNFIRWKVSLLICKIASFIKKEKGANNPRDSSAGEWRQFMEYILKSKQERKSFPCIILTSQMEIYLRTQNDTKEHNFSDFSFVFDIYFLTSDTHLLGLALPFTLFLTSRIKIIIYKVERLLFLFIAINSIVFLSE